MALGSGNRLACNMAGASGFSMQAGGSHLVLFLCAFLVTGQWSGSTSGSGFKLRRGRRRRRRLHFGHLNLHSHPLCGARFTAGTVYESCTRSPPPSLVAIRRAEPVPLSIARLKSTNEEGRNTHLSLPHPLPPSPNPPQIKPVGQHPFPPH